jgi:putative ATPase
MDLFDAADTATASTYAPLAERMRPKRLEDYVGQRHVLGPQSLLRQAIENDRLPSLILWGPPGTGKTTLARLVANSTKAVLDSVSAVLVGVKELKEAIAQAKERRRLYAQRSILFVDEIHRFNKSQQDALLPHVEDGSVTLIGATTENPSFEVNSALLSRTRVVTLRSLEADELQLIVERALSHPQGLNGKFTVEANALTFLLTAAEGDARRALNALELACASVQHTVTLHDMEEAVQHRSLSHDANGEAHYSVVSAFIKSMRASDVDAALYWMVRMVDAGEPLRFVLRRMVIFASEDIGNADPHALPLTVAALQATELVGLPEAMHALAQTVAYLSLAPKSNASYQAFTKARAAVEQSGALPVPLFLRNASSSVGKSLGYGKGYVYPPDDPHAPPQDCLPEGLRGERFYLPRDSGFEKTLQQRLETRRAARLVAEPGSDG